MANTPEGITKDKIKKLFAQKGLIKAGTAQKNWPEVVNGWYFMPVSNGMGVHGIPDFICCVSGIFLAVEAKAAKGVLSEQQKARMGEIDAGGGGTLMVDGSEGTMEVLAGLVDRLIAKRSM